MSYKIDRTLPIEISGSKKTCLILLLLAGLFGTAPVRTEATTTRATHGLREDGRLATDVAVGDLTPIGTNADEPPLGVELGGEDILVDVSTMFPEPKLEITTAGIVYIAVARSGLLGFPQQTNIYRSDDGGRTFSLWSVFDDPSPDGIHQIVDFEIAEGDIDRAFVAYVAGSPSNRYVRVAWADLTPTSPTWNYTTALSAPGSDFIVELDLESDAIDYSSYYLYLAASANSDSGRDIWFTRSSDLGVSWETGYRVVDAPASVSNSDPKLAYGADATIHMAYEFDGPGSDQDESIRIRSAESFADGGFSSWGTTYTLTDESDGTDSRLLAMGTSPADGTVLVHCSDISGGSYDGTRLVWSDNAGLNWSVDMAASTDVYAINRGDMDIDPATGSAWLLGYNDWFDGSHLEITTQRTSLAAPGVLQPPERWCGQDIQIFNSFYDLEHDPSRGNQRAVVWMVFRNDTYEVYFDAEWHRAPGWPNTETGFPIAVDGIGRTPPAIANVDADPQGEIIFATELGMVYVVNHDGTIPAGWPVDLGVTVPWDAPVAVGDLNGDDELEIVIGGDNGWIYAFRPDGAPVNGWPVNLETGAPTFVSIGALGPPYPRHVVALSGNKTVVLKYDGEDLSPNWGTSNEPFTAPAAIGDIDGDGVSEIVSHQSGAINIHRLDSNGQLAFRLFASDPLRGMPALADFDGNGDLEIAVGTTAGKVYLMHHDLSDYSPAFPYDTGNPSPVVGVVPVDLLGIETPELVFSQTDGTTHVVFEIGTSGSGYPESTSTGFEVYMPPIVTNIEGPNPDVVLGSSNVLDCWTNAAVVPEGWPHLLGDFIEESAAAGDIDLDGSIEIVALGLNRLTVLDVGNPPNPQTYRTWPMYGYNAQRTGCLDCTEDAVTAVDDPVSPSPSHLAFAPPFPNPTSARTALSYALPQAAHVKLQIFDVRGRMVRTLTDGQQEAGTHEAFWNGKAANGRRVALGMYLAKLAVNGPNGAEQRVRKISLVR